MRFKTKYNIGDFVMFYNKDTLCNDIGRIIGVELSFSWETLQETKYSVCIKKINSHCFSDKTIIGEINIIERLNKRAFEKAFAEKCAEYIAKGEKQ